MADTAMLPASMATASKGMAGYVRPTLAQETYYRYYPAAATVRRMDEAVQRAEANPYVTRANALTAEVNRIRAEQEARIKRLNDLQSAQLQAQAKMDQASLKAAGAAARGGRGLRFKDVVEAYKVLGEMGSDEAKAYEARLKESNIGDRLNQLSTYGKMDAQPQPIQGAFGLLANQLANKRATGMSESQVMLALRGDAQGKSAFAALQNSPDMVKRASAARALTKVLEARGVSDAGTFAANLLRVSPAMTTAEGEAKVVNDLAVQAQQLVEAGRGEAGTIPLAEQGLFDLIQQNLGGLMAPGGDRGAALAATKKQIAGRQLGPEEQAALDIYLQALRNDGLVTPEDMVGVAGEARRKITQAEIEAGKAAWEKARKNKSYRPQDAQWFDDEFLAQQRKLSAQTSAERTAREEAIGRAERTPEQIQQDMATEFVKSAIAAKGLEVYIPPEQVSSPFEAQALGGALHILRREGNDVMSLDANPEDRTRRLGGAGPLARTPVRVALKTFNQLPKTNGVISDADARQGIAMLRKRFKRDPEKMMLAVQYFMAMDMNAQNQVDAPMGSGRTEPVEAPPVAAPPDTPPPAPEVPVRAQGAGTPDVGAFTEGGVSRGAPPRPAATAQPSVQGLGTDILSSVLGSQRRTDYGESIPPSADFGVSYPPPDYGTSPGIDTGESRGVDTAVSYPPSFDYGTSPGIDTGESYPASADYGTSQGIDTATSLPPSADFGESRSVGIGPPPQLQSSNLPYTGLYDPITAAADRARLAESIRFSGGVIPAADARAEAIRLGGTVIPAGEAMGRGGVIPLSEAYGIAPPPQVPPAQTSSSLFPHRAVAPMDGINLGGGVIPAADARLDGMRGGVIPAADARAASINLGGGVIPVAEASYTGGPQSSAVHQGSRQPGRVQAYRPGIDVIPALPGTGRTLENETALAYLAQYMPSLFGQ